MPKTNLDIVSLDTSTIKYLVLQDLGYDGFCPNYYDTEEEAREAFEETEEDLGSYAAQLLKVEILDEREPEREEKVCLNKECAKDIVPVTQTVLSQ